MPTWENLVRAESITPQLTQVVQLLNMFKMRGTPHEMSYLTLSYILDGVTLPQESPARLAHFPQPFAFDSQASEIRFKFAAGPAMAGLDFGFCRNYLTV